MTVGHEDPQDLAGCFLSAARLLGCMMLLYVLMFLAIFLVAVVGSLLF